MFARRPAECKPGPSTPTINQGTFPTDGIDFSAVYTVQTNTPSSQNYDIVENLLPPFKPAQRASA
jgi:hypothetical protein